MHFPPQKISGNAEQEILTALEPIYAGASVNDCITNLETLLHSIKNGVKYLGVNKTVEICDGFLRSEVRATSLNSLLVGMLNRYPAELAELCDSCLACITPDTVACGASKGRKSVLEIVPGEVSFEIELGEFYDEWTGCRVWPGAVHMSRMLLKHRFDLRGEDVLELGSGLGTCGIASIVSGARSTTFTECKQSVLDKCLSNASANARSVDFGGLILDWSDFDPVTHEAYTEWKRDKSEFIVIGSELVYEDEHGDMIIRVLSGLFASGARRGLIVIMLRPSRPGVENFLSRLRSLTDGTPFTCRIVEEESDDDQQAVCIYLDRR